MDSILLTAALEISEETGVPVEAIILIAAKRKIMTPNGIRAAKQSIVADYNKGATA